MSQPMSRADNWTTSTVDEIEQVQTPKVTLHELEDSLPSPQHDSKETSVPKMVHFLKVPKPISKDSLSLDIHIRSALIDFFHHVNSTFSKLFTKPAPGQHGPYLIRRNVSAELFGHFLRVKDEHWATFYQEAGTGDVYYTGDPSFVHEAVIQLLNRYILKKIAYQLNDAPELPPQVEAAVTQLIRADPMMRRGEAVMEALFQQLGSLEITLREERDSSSEHPRRARPIEILEGRKEADALTLCRWNVKRALLALEVAYSNESLTETGRETFLWCKQRLLAFGLKINASQPGNGLDPYAMLFIAREAQAGEEGSAKAAGLVAHQYMVGRGSKVAVDPEHPTLFTYEGFASHPDAAVRELRDSVDWEGTQPLKKSSQWNRPVDVFDLKEACDDVAVPMNAQLEKAIGALLLKKAGPGTQAVDAQVDSFSPELDRYVNSFGITLRLSEIRAMILEACAQFYDSKQTDSERDEEREEHYCRGRDVRLEAARKRSREEAGLDEGGSEVQGAVVAEMAAAGISRAAAGEEATAAASMEELVGRRDTRGEKRMKTRAETSGVGERKK